MFKKRTELATKKLELTEEARTLKEQLSILQRQRRELSRSHSKTTREAVVCLGKAGAGPAVLRLHYLVGNATWSPTYNRRGTTAGARLSADGPGFVPLWLSLTKQNPAVAARDRAKLPDSTFTLTFDKGLYIAPRPTLERQFKAKAAEVLQKRMRAY